MKVIPEETRKKISAALKGRATWNKGLIGTKDEHVMDRFLAKVKSLPSGCMEWIAHKNYKGYGMFRGRKNKWMSVHRFIYLELVGPIPDTLCIDHLCRNRSCVNVKHMELVTFAENSRRGINYQSLKTECIHGHPLNGDNLYARSDGTRECKKCRHEAVKRNRQRKAKC